MITIITTKKYRSILSRISVLSSDSASLREDVNRLSRELSKIREDVQRSGKETRSDIHSTQRKVNLIEKLLKKK